LGGHERGTEAVRTLPLCHRCAEVVTRARVHTTLHVAAPSRPVPHCDYAPKHAGCSQREADSILAAIWHLLAVGFLVHFYMLCYVCPPPLHLLLPVVTEPRCGVAWCGPLPPRPGTRIGCILADLTPQYPTPSTPATSPCLSRKRSCNFGMQQPCICCVCSPEDVSVSCAVPHPLVCYLSQQNLLSFLVLATALKTRHQKSSTP
jgi:hypothetical protein